MPEFNMNPIVVRSLIFITAINLTVLAFLYWTEVGSDVMGLARPTVALYGVMAAVLALWMTWPHGRETAGFLLATLILAWLLEISSSAGKSIEGKELLVLLALPVFAASGIPLEKTPPDCSSGVSTIKATILVIMTWIYIIATVAATDNHGGIAYFFGFVSSNSLAVLMIYAASPFLKLGADDDATPRKR